MDKPTRFDWIADRIYKLKPQIQADNGTDALLLDIIDDVVNELRWMIKDEAHE